MQFNKSLVMLVCLTCLFFLMNKELTPFDWGAQRPQRWDTNGRVNENIL